MNVNVSEIIFVGDEEKDIICANLDKINGKKPESRIEKRKEIIASGAYVTPTDRTAEEVDNYIKELRADDRF